MRIKRFNENIDSELSKFKDKTTHIADSIGDYTSELSYDFGWYDEDFLYTAPVEGDKIISNDDISDEYISGRLESGEKVFLYMGMSISFDIDLLQLISNNLGDYIPISDFIKLSDDIGSISDTLKSLSDQFDENLYKTRIFADKTAGIISFSLEIIDIKNKFYI